MGNITSSKIKDSNGVLKRSHTAAYNGLGQQINILGNNGQSKQTTFDAEGNATIRQNANNQTTTNEFDALNQIIKITDADNGETTYRYDNQGRVTQVVDAENETTHYEYNAFGDLTKQISPDSGETNYTYDSAGNLLTKTDARSVLAMFSYDALNRVLSQSFTDTTENIAYSYGDTRNGNKGVGRLTSVSDKTGSTSYTYNGFGKITQQTQVIQNASYVTQYQYDINGQLTGITYPSGRVITYTLDNLARINSVATTSVSQSKILASNITYSALGPLTHLDYGNGKTLTQTYDLDYRLATQSTTGLPQLDYGYDLINNIASITGATTLKDYHYDNLSRIINADGDNGSITYRYDKIGNRNSKNTNNSVDSYTYATGSHRLSSINGTNNITLTHDAMGNTLTQGDLTFTYNQQGRLATASKAGMTVTYYYNFKGERVVKIVDSVTTHYGYHQEQLMFENSDNLFKEYIWLNRQPLAAWHQQSSTQTSRINTQVSKGEDDTEERSTGKIKKGSKSLKLVEHKGQSGTIGIRLQHIDIPQGAQIIQANLQFTARRNNRAATHLVIQAEDTGHSLAITKTAYDISSRAKTSTSVNWNPPAWVQGDSTTDQQTPDLSTVIQQVIDRKDWVSGNAITLIITGEGNRKAHTYNSNPVLAAKLNIGYTLAEASTEQLYYYHNDHLGTPQAMTDENQQIMWQANYDPFGQATMTVADITNNLRFPGQYYDSESGLHYNYFRYYDPLTGTYITSDPIGLAGGINTFAYVGGNPINRADPSGLIWWNQGPPNTVPVTGSSMTQLQCVETCLGAEDDWNGDGLLCTGGQEQSGHSQNSHHYSNNAADIAGSSFHNYSNTAVTSCAAQCGFGAGHYEDLPGSSADHWHLQNEPGNGVPELPGTIELSN